MCTNPYKGFVLGIKDNGKQDIMICNYKVHHIEKLPNGQYMRSYDDNIVHEAISKYVDIPCGKCLECRLEFAAQWANRCFVESQQYNRNAFVTLTYDELCVPTSEFVDDDGDFVSNNTLKRSDLSNFIKKLRNHLNYCGKDGKKYYNKDDPEFHLIRFFGAGEYGQLGRPHYHLIIFNWFPDSDDLTFVKMNRLGQPVYKSDLLEELWPYGINTVGSVTEKSCSYVARYVQKKLKDDFDEDIYDKMHVEKEFVVMSRRPGIGRGWFDENKKCYATFLNNYLAAEDGQVKISRNRYYDKMLEQTDPVAYENAKQIRKQFAKHRKWIEADQTSLPYLDYLEVKDRNLKSKTKVLTRKGV